MSTPFGEWERGTPFELYRESRYGVKVDDKHAFMFDTNTLEEIHHRKKVHPPRLPGEGRLARTHDNRLIVVKELQKGVYSGYYVNLSASRTFHDGEIDLIPAGTGKKRSEVYITLEKLAKTHEKESKLLDLLRLEVVD